MQQASAVYSRLDLATLLIVAISLSHAVSFEQLLYPSPECFTPGRIDLIVDERFEGGELFVSGTEGYTLERLSVCQP